MESLIYHFKLIMHGIQPPVGETYFQVEGGNGELGFYVVSDGTKNPYRVRVRPPCFAIYQAFARMITGQTIPELKARIAKTLDFLGSVPAAKIDGSDEREVVMKMRGQDMKFQGAQYLLNHALPNFYFHVTTAYNILRANGVDIGKRDYIGSV